MYPTSDPGPVCDVTTASHFNVVMLTGEKITFPFDPMDSISSLKSKILNALEVDVDKQRLLFNETELTVCAICT